MRFALSEDQATLRDAVRELLAKECPPAVVRAAWEAAPGELDRRPWDALAEMGVPGVLVAEDRGGLGLDETFLVPILEECGRVALPHPIVETAMVAAPLLGADLGMVSTDLGGPNVPCAADADALVLLHDGTLVHTPVDDAARAALTSVATVDHARRAARLPAHAADPAHPTEPVTISHPDGGLAAQARVGRARGAEASARGAALLTDDPATIELALDRGALGTAAVLVGLGQAMLDTTVAYVQARRQFGVAIGSFQAVKHHLADVALALEFARPAVWRAAWSVAHDESSRARDVSMAKAMANDAAQLAGRKALQCHGAIGYTVEADLHLFLKRTWALARAWGDTAHHTDRVASALGA